MIVQAIICSRTKNNQARKIREPSLVLALFRTYGLDIITGGFYKICYDALFYANPLLLRYKPNNALFF